eukprot:scaffold13322_cov54-Phaeocystis_antarctica.AAC.1
MMPNDGADSAAACRTTIVKTADYADSAAVCSDVIQGPCSYRKKENSFPLYKKGQEPCSRATQGKRGSAALRRLQGVQGKWHARRAWRAVAHTRRAAPARTIAQGLLGTEHCVESPLGKY